MSTRDRRREASCRPRDCSIDAGFSTTEVVITIVLFGLAVLAVLIALITMITTAPPRPPTRRCCRPTQQVS